MQSDPDASLPVPLPPADELSVQADPKLIAEGWERRHLVDPDRAKESVELYTAMGFEVKECTLNPADFGPMCQSCASAVCRTYVMIYTRKPAPAQES